MEQRDIVMEIAPYQDDHGLRLRWNNVTLVDGRRDVPGVKFRRDEMLLVPAPERSFFLAASATIPFAQKKEPDAVKGDPLRWGAVAGEALDVFASRSWRTGPTSCRPRAVSREPDGVSLEFERIVDGEVVRHMSGHAVARPSRRHALAAPPVLGSALAAGGLAASGAAGARRPATSDRHRQRHRHLLSGGLADRRACCRARPARAPAARPAVAACPT